MILEVMAVAVLVVPVPVVNGSVAAVASIFFYWVRLSASEGNRSSLVVFAWFNPFTCDAVFLISSVAAFFTGKCFLISLPACALSSPVVSFLSFFIKLFEYFLLIPFCYIDLADEFVIIILMVAVCTIHINAVSYEAITGFYQV